jgi:hypothetical protein
MDSDTLKEAGILSSLVITTVIRSLQRGAVI